MIAIESRQSPHKRCPDYSVIVLEQCIAFGPVGRRHVFVKFVDLPFLKAGAALVITYPQATSGEAKSTLSTVS